MNELTVKETNTPLLYRVNVKTFFDSDADGIGDLNGVICKFPYLVALGVNVVVLEGMTESDNGGITDYCRVSPAVGSVDDLIRFVDAAHAQSVKVYLSLSILSTSCSHPWFEKSSTLTGVNPYREYYLWGEGKDLKGKTPPDLRKNRQGKSIWTHFEKGKWYQAMPAGDAPALNYDNPRVRKEMSEIVRFWREKGVDGFMFDTVPFSILSTNTEQGATLYNSSEKVFGSNAPFYRFLWEIKASFGKDLSILLNAVNGLDEKAYPYLLSGDSPVADQILVDKPLSENPLSIRDFSLKRFIKEYQDLQSAQNAQQLMMAFEDAAHGRLVSAFAKDPKHLFSASKLLCALLLSGVPTPVLYQGEEIGMCNAAKKNLRTCGETPFQWDNRSNGGFTQATFPFVPVNDSYHKINMISEYSDPDSPLSFCQKMIAFRKANEALRAGSFEEFSTGNVLTFTRRSSQESLAVIANLTSDHINYAVPAPLTAQGAECVLCSYSLVGKTLHPSVGLRPFELRIYRLK